MLGTHERAGGSMAARSKHIVIAATAVLRGYCTLALRASMSPWLRSVITPMWLER